MEHLSEEHLVRLDLVEVLNLVLSAQRGLFQLQPARAMFLRNSRRLVQARIHHVRKGWRRLVLYVWLDGEDASNEVDIFEGAHLVGRHVAGVVHERRAAHSLKLREWHAWFGFSRNTLRYRY